MPTPLSPISSGPARRVLGARHGLTQGETGPSILLPSVFDLGQERVGGRELIGPVIRPLGLDPSSVSVQT